MVTLKELAEECNVSIATISNILNGKSNVSKETKERVLKIIKKRGYKPNYMARGLRSISTKSIGVLVDDLGAFGTPEMLEGICAFSEQNGYKAVIETLRIYTSLNGTKSIGTKEFLDKINSKFNEMLAMRVNAIIYVAAFSREITYLPKDFPVPIVLAYASTNDESIPYVIPEDLKAAEEITEYLIAHGGKKIALIKGTEKSIHSQLREEGFRNVMKKHELTVEETLIENGLWNSASGYQACKAIFERGKPDSIFCFNDDMAAGAYQYLMENNIVPGKDIKIVGFDNNKISSSLPPPLTTMAISVFGIGYTSAQLTLRKIAGEKIYEHIVKIPCKFIERDSAR